MRPPAVLGPAVGQVAAAGCCRHPVRLMAQVADAGTGELVDRRVLVACKDRREILCPACAQTYQADAFHLVAAGLRGGKGVPPSVAAHPACFLTLTAPGFGPVHSAAGTPGRPCHPRRRAPLCPHGRRLSCEVRHRADDPVLGRPLCPGCFDYEGAVLWNAGVSILWKRCPQAVARVLGQRGGVPVRSIPHTFRLAYIKVVEFQRRGLVHLHVVVRADGPTGPDAPPPPWLDGATLVEAIATATAGVSAAGPADRPLVWGRERTVRVLGDDDRDTVAAYLAKYAVKAATTVPMLARRIDDGRLPVLSGADPHVAELVTTAWRLGTTRSLRPLRLRAHAHTFGYGGHFATKSRLWSTTFQALRDARADHAKQTAGDDVGPLVVGPWAYGGRGYDTEDATALAEVLAEAISTRPRKIPKSPEVLPTVPRPSGQGR